MFLQQHCFLSDKYCLVVVLHTFSNKRPTNVKLLHLCLDDMDVKRSERGFRIKGVKL